MKYQIVKKTEDPGCYPSSEYFTNIKYDVVEVGVYDTEDDAVTLCRLLNENNTYEETFYMINKL